MELRQLKYFVVVADFGSINKASEALFTSQPNVSKVINSLEKELGVELFSRNSKGVRLSLKGQELYDRAKTILKNADIISSLASNKVNRKLKVSCYQSHMISRVMCDYYNKYKDDSLKIEFLEDTVEQIIDNVRTNHSDIGIVYVSQDQKCCFNHILEHKNIEFHILDEKQSCIYVGKNNEFYNRKSVKFNELISMKFVQPVRDFFSVEQYLDRFDNVITTNSDNLIIDLLLVTEICTFGINFIKKEYEQYDIRCINIEDYDNKLLIGYIKRKGEGLSKESSKFIELLEGIIK